MLRIQAHPNKILCHDNSMLAISGVLNADIMDVPERPDPRDHLESVSNGLTDRFQVI